jgi:hypothetical protein
MFRLVLSHCENKWPISGAFRTWLPNLKTTIRDTKTESRKKRAVPQRQSSSLSIEQSIPDAESSLVYLIPQLPKKNCKGA